VHLLIAFPLQLSPVVRSSVIMLQFKHTAASSALLHSRAERGALCNVRMWHKVIKEINPFFEVLMILELIKLTAGGGLPLLLDSFSRSSGRNVSLGY